eukprot:jgi/Bigna1/76545/fgenesh1_pg.42_\
MRGTATDEGGEATDEGAKQLLATTRGLLASSSRRRNLAALPEKEIRVLRMKDLNIDAPSEAVVSSQWRSCADSRFTGDGAQVVCTSRRQHFFVVDVADGRVQRVPGIKGRRDKSFEKLAMESGPGAKYMGVVGAHGNLLVLSQQSKQYLFGRDTTIIRLKVNAPISSVVFGEAKNCVYMLCETGEVYTFDLRTRRCLSRHFDEGAVKGTSMACSKDGSTYACGSSSGVVNIYDSKAAAVATSGGKSIRPS